MSGEPSFSTAQFEGWAVIEIFGHTKDAGFVTTQYFGSACLFRIDVPELPEREVELKRPEYFEINRVWRTWPAGTIAKGAAMPARSKLIGPNSIFSLTPCTEEFARRAIEEIYPRPLVLVGVPETEQAQLEAGLAEHEAERDLEAEEV